MKEPTPEQSEARKAFIEFFANYIGHQASTDYRGDKEPVTRAYTELAVSHMLDAVLFYRDQLDIEAGPEGYTLDKIIREARNLRTDRAHLRYKQEGSH